MCEGNNGNSSIIEFPEIIELRKEIQKSRTELSVLLFEQDEILYVEYKGIEE